MNWTLFLYFCSKMSNNNNNFKIIGGVHYWGACPPSNNTTQRRRRRRRWRRFNKRPAPAQKKQEQSISQSSDNGVVSINWKWFCLIKNVGIKICFICSPYNLYVVHMIFVSATRRNKKRWWISTFSFVCFVILLLFSFVCSFNLF